MEELRKRLREAAGRIPNRRPPSEGWYRIEVTPDVELSVRMGESLGEREIAMLEEIAAYMAQIIKGEAR